MPKLAAAKPKTKPSLERVRAHRERLRKKGLKPIQFWVPDVHSEQYKAEAKRQCLAIAHSSQEKEDIAFVESLIVWDES